MNKTGHGLIAPASVGSYGAPAVGGYAPKAPAVGGYGAPAVGGYGLKAPAVGGYGLKAPAVGGYGLKAPINTGYGIGAKAPVLGGYGAKGPALGGYGAKGPALGGYGNQLGYGKAPQAVPFNNIAQKVNHAIPQARGYGSRPAGYGAGYAVRHAPAYGRPAPKVGYNAGRKTAL